MPKLPGVAASRQPGRRGRGSEPPGHARVADEVQLREPLSPQYKDPGISHGRNPSNSPGRLRAADGRVAGFRSGRG